MREIVLSLNYKNLLRTVAGRFLNAEKSAASPFDVFLTPSALAINLARQRHLASLGLNISGKRVLEVGAGIGLHTPFYLERGCNVVVTDGRNENVQEAHRRLPGVETDELDLETGESLLRLGRFDIVYCYGLLYHLGNPEHPRL